MREFIEGPEARSQLPDAEKSLINEMCNVSVQVPIILNNKGGGGAVLAVCMSDCLYAGLVKNCWHIWTKFSGSIPYDMGTN